MPNSDSKGKRGERELCRKLREHGFGAIRTAQVAGIKNHDDSADIMTSLDPEIRFEVKRGYESVSIASKKFDQWRQKAVEETPMKKYPILAWRKNRQPWVFFLLAEGKYTRAEFSVGVEAFVDKLYRILGDHPAAYQVDDPFTWKTTDVFS